MMQDTDRIHNIMYFFTCKLDAAECLQTADSVCGVCIKKYKFHRNFVHFVN